MASLKVAGASEYLAITGLGIEDVKITKKALVWIGQKCLKFDTTPVNYEIHVHAMSSEKKVPLIVTAAFTVGPKVNDDKAPLVLYAKLVASVRGKEKLSHVVVRDLIKGVVEGETRARASSMTMEEMSLDLPGFVVEKVQLELNKFGLYIYNADVKQQPVIATAKAELLATKKAAWDRQTKVDAEIELQMEEYERMNALQLAVRRETVDAQTKVEPDEVKMFDKEIEEYELYQMEEEYERMNARLTNEYETQAQDSNKHKAGETKAEMTRMRSSWFSRLLKPLASCVGSFSAELVMQAMEDELN
ncbi:hypothetical protein QOZ80_3BG0292750 [Eleusine coracana subsp. coracana]|nr:hypothetical protein QOZ80_3BG0292750 [Eleusine coracana subsp. coracana]